MAAVVDNRTSNYNVPLPNAGNWLSEDVIRLAQAITAFDQLIKSANDDIAGRALLDHAHQISEITGLSDILAQKAAYDHVHALAALSDVDVSIITVGQYLRWNGAKWVPGVVSADDIKAGVMDPARLPSIAITDTYVVASQAQMLALDVQKGDIAVRTDLNRSYICSGTNPALLTSWTELLTPTDAVLSVAGLTGAVSADALRTALGALRYDAPQALTAAQQRQAQDNMGVLPRDLLIGYIFDDASPLGAQPGFLWAEGQAVSRTTYAKLFARLGTRYGAGDGSTTFNIPDLRARLTMGADSEGASATGRLGTYLTSNAAIGTVGGSAHMQSHNHTGSGSTSASGDHPHWLDLSTGTVGNHQHWVGSGAYTNTISHTVMPGSSNIITGHVYDNGRWADGGGAHAHNVSGNTGWAGNHAHSISFTTDGAGSGSMGNLPPLMLVRKVIYTGVH